MYLLYNVLKIQNNIKKEKKYLLSSYSQITIISVLEYFLLINFFCVCRYFSFTYLLNHMYNLVVIFAFNATY